MIPGLPSPETPELKPTLAASLVSLAAVLASCVGPASYQTVPMPDQAVDLERDDHARLYVIRADQVLWQRNPLLVHDAGELIGSLRPGAYLCWEREPGRVLGRLVLERQGQSRLEQVYDVHLEAGETRWVEVAFDNAEQRLVTELLDEAAGRALVAASSAAAER